MAGTMRAGPPTPALIEGNRASERHVLREPGRNEPT